MNPTPLHEIEGLPDAMPVLVVEGKVKFVDTIRAGTSESGVDWSLQGFVLTDGKTDVRCVMWDADDTNKVTQGEQVRFESTTNKKNQWTGITKKIDHGKPGTKHAGKTFHKLELRANNVIWGFGKGGDEHGVRAVEESGGGTTYERDPDWPEAEQSPATTLPLPKPNGDAGVLEARRHLMQSANLYCLCTHAVENVIMTEINGEHRTPEIYQAAISTLFIEASRAGMVDKMPVTPLK